MIRRGWVVWVALLAGCPSAHPAPSREELVRLLEEMDGVVCDRMRACASWTSSSDAWCDGMLRSGRSDLLGAGAAELDVAQAEACIEGVRALGACVLRVRDETDPIDPNLALEETCRAAFRPTPSCGETTCDPEDPCVVAADCTFFCRDLPALMEPCTTECGVGLECVGGTCVRPPPTIAPCHGGGLDDWIGCVRYWDVGDPCGDDAECGPLAHCEAGVCSDAPPRIAVDAPCDPGAGPPCVRGALCDPSRRRCLPRFEVEGRCEQQSECRDGTYCDGLVCVSDPEGVPCRARSLDLLWADECPEGYLCAPDLRCHRPLAPGDACTAESACPLGTGCSGGVCAPLALRREACGPDVACRPADRCIDGVCVSRRTLPPSCAIDADCEEGRCTSGECRPLADGATCARDTDCPRCVDGVCQPPTILELGEVCDLAGPIEEHDAICASDAVCTFRTYTGTGRCCPL